MPNKNHNLNDGQFASAAAGNGGSPNVVDPRDIENPSTTGILTSAMTSARKGSPASLPSGGSPESRDPSEGLPDLGGSNSGSGGSGDAWDWARSEDDDDSEAMRSMGYGDNELGSRPVSIDYPPGKSPADQMEDSDGQLHD